MFYQTTHTQYTLKFLKKIVIAVKTVGDIVQRSMEATAYSRILHQYGSSLTEEQRNQIRKNLQEIMNKNN